MCFFSLYNVGFVSDTMSYVVLRVYWCNTIFRMRVHQLRRKVMIQKSF